MNRTDWFVRVCWIAFAVALFLTVVIGLLWADECQTQQDKRDEISLAIARFYGLTRDQGILLLAIRDHENSEMKTFSYYGIRREDRPELKYCRSDRDEYIDATRICAEQIRLYCPNIKTSKIMKFNCGYGNYPGYAVDHEWWRGVKRKMREYQNIIY